MPSSAYTETIFEDCEGDLQLPAGVYVVDGASEYWLQKYALLKADSDAPSVATTWKQPASLTPGSTLPWQPSIPASSSCTTYSSAQLFGTAVSTSL